MLKELKVQIQLINDFCINFVLKFTKRSVLSQKIKSNDIALNFL